MSIVSLNSKESILGRDRPSEHSVLLMTDSDLNASTDFSGLAKLKRSRRERHHKALESFEKFLDELSEAREGDVLRLSIAIRDAIEDIDNKLETIYNNYSSDDYLIVREESDLLTDFQELSNILSDRSFLIVKLGQDLESIERNRADIMSTELKKLVDTLIGIAHQLPNEIEHIIEDEASDFNELIVQNRMSHEDLLILLHIKQIEVEIESKQRWEDCRMKWRQLRHLKAINSFKVDIHSARFFDPVDRKEFLLTVKSSQQDRQNIRDNLFNYLLSLDAQTLSSKDIASVKEKFGSLADDELTAIQQCYDSLQDMRKELQIKAEQRREDLRKELHVYGALALEPNRQSISQSLDIVLKNEQYHEFFRLGGSLKPDLQHIANELCSSDIVYPRVVDSIIDRLVLIESGFPLRQLMTDKGRESVVDRIRVRVSKLRVVPRSELYDLVVGLCTDIEELAVESQLPQSFTTNLSVIASDMNKAILTIKEERAKNEQDAANALNSTGKLATLTSTSLSNQLTESRRRQSISMKGSSIHEKKLQASMSPGHLDPLLVKAWYKKLAVLFISCDLPSEFKELCLACHEAMKQQSYCNSLVDGVTYDISEKVLNRIDSEYKTIIDDITTFAESNALRTSIVATNMCNFYHSIAYRLEHNATKQVEIDEKSKDQIWDVSEDFRLESEDREAYFLKACQALRGSISEVQLDTNFDAVLQTLEVIKESYSIYHELACFTCDKYPLQLLYEYRALIQEIGSIVMLDPCVDHPTFQAFANTYNDVQRLNKKFFDENPDAAGIGLIESNNKANDSSQNTMYSSPLSKSAPLVGKYRVMLLNEEILGRFNRDGGFIAPLEVESPQYRSPRHLQSSNTEQLMHEEYPFLKREAESFVPLSTASISALDEDSLYEYDQNIKKYFVDLGDIEALIKENQEKITAYNLAVSKAKKGTPVEPLDQSVLWTDNIDLVNMYKCNKLYFQECNQSMTSDPSRFINKVEVSDVVILNTYSSIRDRVIFSIESEMYTRSEQAREITNDRKSQLTEELEDRIRLHWPRRGRVETQIKQPRLSELRSHEEKTWRHIESVHHRMAGLHDTFESLLNQGNDQIQEYVNDIKSMTNLLKSTSNGFKTLANLQAYDVKARSRTISSQHSHHQLRERLESILKDEIAAVSQFALDFKKICPLQVVGNSLDDLASNSSSGYSQAELDEIDVLLQKLTTEIQTVSDQWTIKIKDLETIYSQSSSAYEKFLQVYEECSHDLAMSEGLGQKYGAPRRRAQEKTRTELSRDESAASLIDSVLSDLERLSVSAEEGMIEGSDNPPLKRSLNAREAMDIAMDMWTNLAGLRQAFNYRIQYLRVLRGSPLPNPSLPWIIDDTVRSSQSKVPQWKKYDESYCPIFPSTSPLDEIVDDIEKTCKQETKELYATEGRTKDLTSEGIPQSLDIWLKESRQKILGEGGYRERAWKKLWEQMLRYEAILMRRLCELEDKDEENNALIFKIENGAPSVCIRLLKYAYIKYLYQQIEDQALRFAALMKAEDATRAIHERMLRPRLGQEGAIDELNQLNEAEIKRSQEYVKSVQDYRQSLLSMIIQYSKRFVQDIGTSTEGLLILLDSSLKQDCLQVPPNTSVPKMRLTTKRMRKAQKLREAVALGQTEDKSRERVWPCLAIADLKALLISAQMSITPPKPIINELSPRPQIKGSPEKPMKAVRPTSSKLAPSKQPSSSVSNESQPPEIVLLNEWANDIANKTSVKAGVSTAHRIIIKARDEIVEDITASIKLKLDEVKSCTDSLLLKEASWNERWNRQVKSLKLGSL